MTIGRLYFFSKLDPNRPIEEKYVTEVNEQRKSFIFEEDALLYLFDNGVKTFSRYTKELHEYKDITKIPTYELMRIEHRVGYLTHGLEQYLDENNNVKKRKAYIWRFIGVGRSCFAKTREELIEKVSLLIENYKVDSEGRGYNTYPYYTKHWRIKDLT